MKRAGAIAGALGLCALLTGCGLWNKHVSAAVFAYTTVCVKETGVMYVQFPTGAAALYKPDGSLVTCGK